MERNTDRFLKWHVTDISLDKVEEAGRLKGVALQLEIRMPYGALGRALVSLTRKEEVITERNLLLPGDMRMPAFPAADNGCEKTDESGREKEGGEKSRLVNAQVFLPVEMKEGLGESDVVYGMKICLFDGEDVCREGICIPGI